MTGWDVDQYTPRALLDTVPVGVTIHDPSRPDVPVRYANDRFCSLTGHDREAVAGTTLDGLAGPERDATRLYRLLDRLDDECVPVVIATPRADGSTFLNRVRAAPLGDGHTLLVHDDIAGEREAVDLVAVSEACWRTLVTERTELSVRTDQRIRADSHRLEQLLEHLFHNAVEHGDAWHVTLGELPDDSGFYVADDGSGIPKDERESVFDTAEDGTGFGLTICQQVAEFHGWELALTDNRDGGARFEVSGVELVRADR